MSQKFVFFESGRAFSFSNENDNANSDWCFPKPKNESHFAGYHFRSFAESHQRCKGRVKKNRNSRNRGHRVTKNGVNNVFSMPLYNDWVSSFSDHHHRADSRQKSAGVPLIHQPRAPKNTTQFLITDREERESSDREFVASTSSANAVADTIGEADCSSEMLPVVTTTTMAVTKEANNHPLGRSRCNTAPSNPRSSSGNSDVNDMEEDIEDPEFAAMYDDYNFERIKNLSREEVNREMLETQKSNLHLTEKVGLLKAENQRLHALLNTYGVMDTSAPPNGTSFPSALRKSTSPYTKAANEKRET